MKTTRHVGNCQICAKDHKVRDGLMVHHGYEVKDHQFQKDCAGIFQPPYETSCDLIKTYKAAKEKDLALLRKRLKDLEADRIDALPHLEYVRGERQVVEYRREGTPAAKWQDVLYSNRRRTDGKIRLTEEIIDLCGNRIRDWKRRPLRTVEEEQQKVDAGKQARVAVVHAKRAEKVAKKAETKAKQAALEKSRQELTEDFARQFRELAAQPMTPAVQAAAKALSKKVWCSKTWNWLYPKALGCDDALLALGLAKRVEAHGRSWVIYWFQNEF